MRLKQWMFGKHNMPRKGVTPGIPGTGKTNRRLTLTERSLVPTKPYKTGKKSKRIRRHRWE